MINVDRPIQLTLSKGTSLFETNILFGTSEIPSRVFVGYQTQSIFSGNYKKAYFAFERRFHKDGSLNHSEPSQSFSYIEPAIPPESPTVPPESNLTQVHEEAGSVSATIRNLFGRFRRMDQNPDQTINDNENITIELCQALINISKRILKHSELMMSTLNM